MSRAHPSACPNAALDAGNREGRKSCSSRRGRTGGVGRDSRIAGGGRRDCSGQVNGMGVVLPGGNSNLTKTLPLNPTPSPPMPKSARTEQIEAMLAADPEDSFLSYALAMEYVSSGDDATAAELLSELARANPDEPYVPAYLMAGQAYQRLGKDVKACAILRQGIAAATKTGNDHARGEMEGLLASIE